MPKQKEEVGILDRIRASWVRAYGKVQADALELSVMPNLAKCQADGDGCAEKYFHMYCGR